MKSRIPQLLAAALETAVGALAIAMLYLLYLPFGIAIGVVRAAFDMSAVRNFWGDALFGVEALAARMRRRRDGEL